MIPAPGAKLRRGNCTSAVTTGIGEPAHLAAGLASLPGWVAAFLFVTAVSVDSLAVFSAVSHVEQDEVTVESTDLTLRLNDEF